MTFGEKLNGILVQKRMTQKELALKMRCTEGAVSHWITGRAKPRSWPQMQHLARVLQISPNDLTDDNEEGDKENGN